MQNECANRMRIKNKSGSNVLLPIQADKATVFLLRENGFVKVGILTS